MLSKILPPPRQLVSAVPRLRMLLYNCVAKTFDGGETDRELAPRLPAILRPTRCVYARPCMDTAIQVV